MSFWVYILRCSDNSFYTGHTDNLEKRLSEHESGLVLGYTSTRLPVTFLSSQDFPTRLEALNAERQIKGWSRLKKQALIDGDWGRLSELSRNRQGTASPDKNSSS